MKVYTLEEARLMHSIGIRMRCISASKLPSFINQNRVFMVSPTHMKCEDTKGNKFYHDLFIRDSYSEWVIADDI